MYHEWINQHRRNIIPDNIPDIEHLKTDLDSDPQRYLKSMIYMCICLEKNETKSFQFFPIRSDIVPKYIPIDTASLIDLFVKENKNKYLADIEYYKNMLWSTLLNTSDPIFKQKNYTFDHRISTDGFAISIQLINNACLEKEQAKKNNMKIARQTAMILYKDLSQDEIEKIKNQRKIDEKNRKAHATLENRRISNENKALFKKLSKEEQELQKKRIKRESKEFIYLEDLTDAEYKELQTANWVVIDPGKNSLVYIKNNDGETLDYTNRTHIHRTKRIKYQKLIENYKKKNEISKIEKELADFNSKSCLYDKFKEYIKQKNEANSKLLAKYENEVFRKYKWYGHINRKKAETALVKDIKTKFGKDVTLIYGDWSAGKQMKGHISTPGIGLKRKLREHFKIYNLDEFRTSCLSSKTMKRCDNLYLPDKTGIIRKIHSVLTYKMENKRMGCINRDNNATNNQLAITNQYLKDKTRPMQFRRDGKKEIGRITRDPNQEFTYDQVITLYISGSRQVGSCF